jgi:hypothetical protein
MAGLVPAIHGSELLKQDVDARNKSGHDGLMLNTRPTVHQHPISRMIHPNFTPDITLGHLMQALVVLSTVGGGIVGTYVSLRSDIDLQRAEFRVAVAGHEARLNLVERQLEQRHNEDRQFQAEMRGALDRVMQAIAGLRTELVQKQDRKAQ